ncbi:MULTISPECIES: hypothetical protein [unclassified Pseudomonas]|uniref:hypothetical protein n=1 Tax=unclassified Pseudomonas TaxID=196821 RepID=UPI000D393E10|nr:MULTISPECIES: hypothetical protein [unclassified Pseudomonas]RAU46634.1 hypothetical protein DBP26_010510 [Pseudomonas sp. RIT 409]RAU52590.1 hypothetical protein DBY65_017340 [Pseudomonas sp. RIT 412]
MDKSTPQLNASSYLDGKEDTGLSDEEIEVRLAIADYVIRRVAATPNGQQIFEALLPRFENKYPHHKLLSLYLTSPGHIDPNSSAR